MTTEYPQRPHRRLLHPLDLAPIALLITAILALHSSDKRNAVSAARSHTGALLASAITGAKRLYNG